jgi:tetratricopeptide (TPR) repeat protein
LSEWARVKGAGAVRVEKEILSALAWRLGTNRTLLSADEAAAAMSARLTKLQSKKEARLDLNVDALNREFLHHGLLRESAGQTGFFHQAVQEYFFAREVALHQSMEYVLKHVGDPEWAEVLVFVCGLIEDATEVVREVMKVDPYLAARCATYANKIAEEIIDETILIIIQKIKTKLEADIWVGKLYPEIFTILSIEAKTNIKKLSALFYRGYNQNLKGLYDFADMLLWMHIPEKVIPLVEPLVKEDPSSVWPRYLLAYAFHVAKDFNAATPHYKKCLDLAPQNARIWSSLGIIYNDMNKLQEAEFCLRRAIEIDNKLMSAHCHLGFTLKGQKNYEGAFEQFQQAISFDWDYGLPHLGLAGIYHKHLNQLENAISEYEIAIQLDQRSFVQSLSTIGLASALEAAGRTAEARQRYQEYLDRFPWGEHAPEALAALERLGA